MDYFEILGCKQTDALAIIKARYHALQREYHPDTFFQSPDTDLKECVLQVAKRVAEAYVILRDAEKREKYLRDISSPNRETRLRYTEETEQEVRREKEEILGKTAQGRKLVEKAIQSIKGGNLLGAQNDLKTALLFEPNNDQIRERLNQVQASLAAEKK